MPGIEDALTDAAGGQDWMEIERFFHKKDRHYAKTYLEEQAKYEILHEETRQGIHSCRVQRAACSAVDERISKLVLEVKQNMLGQVQHHRQDRHVAETHREKLAEKAIAEARGLMIEEQESRKQTHKYTEEVTNEICHLYNDLDKARNYRLQKSEKLQEVVEEKLDEIHIAISAEKKIREESTSTMLDLFSDMGVKMQKEIDAVKTERKASTDRLIQLMEVVLPHLEQARLNHVKLVHEKMEEQKATAALATFAADNFNKKRQSTEVSPKRQSIQRLSTKRSLQDSTGESTPASVTRMSVNDMKSIGAMLPMIQHTESAQAARPEAQAEPEPFRGTEDGATRVDPTCRESDQGAGVSLPQAAKGPPPGARHYGATAVEPSSQESDQGAGVSLPQVGQERPSSGRKNGSTIVEPTSQESGRGAGVSLPSL